MLRFPLKVSWRVRRDGQSCMDEETIASASYVTGPRSQGWNQCQSPDGHTLKPGLFPDTWTPPRKMYQRWLRLDILKKCVLLYKFCACVCVCARAHVYESVPLSVTCSLLYFLTSLALHWCCASVSASWYPFQTLGSVWFCALGQVVWSCSAP